MSELCACGKRGCLEMYASEPAMLREAAEAFQQGRLSFLPKTPEELIALAEEGETAAQEIFAEAGRLLGQSIANLVNIFNPQLVVLGGYYSVAHESVIPMIKETIRRHSLFPMRTALSVLPSQRGVDDSILGAVALVLDDRMRAPV